MNKNPNDPRLPDREDRGSALVLAVFVLALLTGMGTALLFLSQQEAKMGMASLRTKQAFYLAEAGLEDGRISLYVTNGGESFDDDLTAAAGADGVIDFDPYTVKPTYDSDGNVTGFSGVNDDVPIRPLTSVGDSTTNENGWYAAFLTNDPIDSRTVATDSNDRVLITGVGMARNGAREVVEAIIEPRRILPEVPAAAITMLGPLPSFDNGNSNAQSHAGEDCGVAGGPFAPIIGSVNGAGANQIQSDAHRLDAAHFNSGPFAGAGTIGNLTDPIDPIVAGAGHGTIAPNWLDCWALKEMVLNLAANADHYCNSDFAACSIPSTSAPDDIVFIDGDLSNTPNSSNTGILVVTGQLTYSGNTGWDGVILAIGRGYILRNGGGGGVPSGAVVIANIDPSPGGPAADKGDWCTSSGDGFLQAWYHTNGGGNSEVQWCSASTDSANSVREYRVVQFLQH